MFSSRALRIIGLLLFAIAVAPVDAVVYYGGYTYGEDGFQTYGGAAVVRPGIRPRRYRYGRKLLQQDKKCKTMLDVVESLPQLSSLKEAIKDLPKIRDALNNSTAQDTFFAPSNEAIASLTLWGGFDDFKRGLEGMFSSDEIKALVVAYHAIPDQKLNWGQLRAKAAKGEFLPTALSKIFPDSSAALEVSWWKGDIFLKGVGSEAKISAADIPACGSIVHVIDGVLLPLDGDGELSDEQKARIEAARIALGGKDEEPGDAPAPAPDAAPAPAPAEVFPDDIEELDVDYPMEDQYGEAPAPAPAP